MSAISTTGARIDRWDNGRPAHREQARLIEAVKLERSSRYLCSEGFITFISKPHDDDAALILAPYNPGTIQYFDAETADPFDASGCFLETEAPKSHWSAMQRKPRLACPETTMTMARFRMSA
jgi:hypothetical protein